MFQQRCQGSAEAVQSRCRDAVVQVQRFFRGSAVVLSRGAGAEVQRMSEVIMQMRCSCASAGAGAEVLQRFCNVAEVQLRWCRCAGADVHRCRCAQVHMCRGVVVLSRC
jgi:hypothetical protein